MRPAATPPVMRCCAKSHECCSTIFAKPIAWARMGGDEFAVLLENCPPSHVSSIAEKLRTAAQQLQITREKTLRTGFSIGVVHIPGDSANASDLLRMADMACYQAKERGRNKVFFYTAEDGIPSRYVSEMEWATRIRSALDEDRFCLYAQNIAPLQTSKQSNKHRGMHFEVLLRLRDENGRFSHPAPLFLRQSAMASCQRSIAGSSPSHCRHCPSSRSTPR